MLKNVHMTLMMGKVIAKPVSRDLIDALTEVTITENDHKQSGFQLKFNVSKTSRIVNELMPSGYFDPPTRVIVVVTFRGTPHVLMDGVITRHDWSPSNEPGQTTLSLTGSDVSAMMDLQDFSFIPWPMPPEARVLIILAKYAMYGVVPTVIPSLLLFIETIVEKIPKQNGTDLRYVRQLAKDVGHIFYIEPGPTPGMNRAYWGPEVKLGTPQPALSVNMDAHTNVESLSFSFDGIKKTLYSFFIQTEFFIPIPIPVPDITPLNPPLGSKVPIPLSITPLTYDTSKDSDKFTAKMHPVQAALQGLASASAASNVISGSGSLDVPRYGHILRPRKLVGVRGAGVSYDGTYYVSSVTHSLKSGQFKQSFTLSRNAHESHSTKVRL